LRVVQAGLGPARKRTGLVSSAQKRSNYYTNYYMNMGRPSRGNQQSCGQERVGGPPLTLAYTPHFRIAWAAFKADWRVFVMSQLILVGMWVSLELAVVALHSWGLIPWLALHIAFLLVFSGVLVGIQAMAMQVVDGTAPALSVLPQMLNRGPSFLFAACLYTVGSICGLLLLVAPGIYFAVRYSFFGYVIGSKRVSALKALREAGDMTQGRWWRVCGFLLSLLALNLVGAAMLGLGLLVSFPLSLLAATSFSRSLATHP
jgi:hypothetical protein